MRGSRRSLLPLTVALFWWVGDCQRDFTGQLDQRPSYRSEPGNKETARLRFRNQGNLGTANKMFHLLQVHSPAAAMDHIPVTPQTDIVPSAWMRSLAGRENRKPPSAPSDHRVPLSTNGRSQTINPSKSDAPGRSLSWTPQQRQRMDMSQQWLRNSVRSRSVPQPRTQISRSRMVG